MGSTIVFLFVMDTTAAYREGVVSVAQARENLAATGTAILDRAERLALDADVQADGELAEGDPVEVISRRAAYADLVVMGSHGKGIWRRLAIGSVSSGVLHRITCPLLIVRRDPDTPWPG